jgi:hypothetical protein
LKEIGFVYREDDNVVYTVKLCLNSDDSNTMDHSNCFLRVLSALPLIPCQININFLNNQTIFMVL